AEYFTEKDEIYVNLFEEASVRAPTQQQKATRLFLVLVANTNDLSIGPTCKVDKDATYTTFSQLAEFLKIQFVPSVIEGKDFSKINVDNAINGIRPASNDIVVFYYSGHGFNDVKTNYKFPFLDLRDKTYQQFGEPYTLNIEDIFKRIKMKGARMNLVISDCCNADPSQSNIAISDGASTRTSSVGWNIGNCWSLFMNNKPGSILVTAAQKGSCLQETVRVASLLLISGNPLIRRWVFFTITVRGMMYWLLHKNKPLIKQSVHGAHNRITVKKCVCKTRFSGWNKRFQMHPENISPQNKRRKFLKQLSAASLAALTPSAWATARQDTFAKLPLVPLQPDEQYWEMVKQQFTVPPNLIMVNAANLCPSPYFISEQVNSFTKPRKGCFISVPCYTC
ncbi:MAG: hypothetical protein HC867_08410, partial [Bacteroidia bacterium]|nr:hypothetical protein [Bacteroidia bacterium]